MPEPSIVSGRHSAPYRIPPRKTAPIKKEAPGGTGRQCALLFVEPVTRRVVKRRAGTRELQASMSGRSLLALLGGFLRRLLGGLLRRLLGGFLGGLLYSLLRCGHGSFTSPVYEWSRTATESPAPLIPWVDRHSDQRVLQGPQSRSPPRHRHKVKFLIARCQGRKHFLAHFFFEPRFHISSCHPSSRFIIGVSTRKHERVQVSCPRAKRSSDARTLHLAPGFR